VLARCERPLLALLFCTALGTRLAWAMIIPPYQAPDERAHVRYAEYVVEHRRLPVQPAPELPRLLGQWEQYFQPPLAYVLFAPLTSLLGAAGVAEPRLVYALRLQNAVYGAVTAVIGFWVMAALTPPADPRRWLAAVFMAFLPGFVGTTSAVNNDALANLLCAALWLPLVAARPRRRPWVLGVVLGSACLAKLTVLPLVPMIAVVPLLRGEPPRAVLRDVVIGGGLAALFVAPWMLRNVSLYGEPFGTSLALLTFDWLAVRLPPEAVAAGSAPEPLRAFLQFWGRFGIFGNVSWRGVPAVMIPLALLGITGWLRRNASPGDALTKLAIAFLLAVVLVAGVLISYSLRYYAGWQGRYLYPALLPASALLACGWARWIVPRRPWMAAGALFAILAAVDASVGWKLHRFYAAAAPARWGLRVFL